MRRLQTATLSNQNITSYLLLDTYTADADRAVIVSFYADQVAGNGDYLAYVTIQKGGAGSAYMAGPITTFTVPSGITSISFSSIILPLENTDVAKVYLKGLAGDTTTPDIITRWFELTYLRPSTVGRTLNIGSDGIAEANLKQILGTTLTETAGYLAAAFKKFFNIQTPVLTVESVNQSGDVYPLVDTEIAAIKAKTDNLPSDPADQSQVEAAITAATSPLATAAALATVAGYVDTEVAAIKAKTDNLPTDPADQSLIIAAIAALPTAAQIEDAVLDAATADHQTANTIGKAISDAGGGNVQVTSFVSIGTVDAQSLAEGTLSLRTQYQFNEGYSSDSTDNLSTARHVFAVKRAARDADADALILIDTSPDAPATAGLQVVNGAAYATQANGNVVVSGSSGAWEIGFLIKAAATAELDSLTPAYNLIWEDKYFLASAPTVPVLGASGFINIISGAVKEL